jgi:copper chaperone CopZ
VGKAALEGLHGVKTVEKGFRGAREINTVTYDSTEITVERMVEALTRAGTYRGTAVPPIDASLPGATETATFALG